jgi:hypothetical protein
VTVGFGMATICPNNRPSFPEATTHKQQQRDRTPPEPVSQQQKQLPLCPAGTVVSSVENGAALIPVCERIVSNAEIIGSLPR